MARRGSRRGSFGSSLNPFGTGTFGGLAQYNIGDNLKDLAAYRAEIAWRNGQITDAEYQASLAGLVAAADPGTLTLLSAENKLHDVTYRIGRSEAEAAGLDSLIAFYQQALAGMNPGNVRYRNVKDSLDSGLARRRARDYGQLVDAYNAGQASTESLLAWVENTRALLPADAPDADNWDSVRASLADRIVGEKDAQIYQDYQDRKISPEDFIAYLTGRRDAYGMDSPKWDEANRRLEDAQENVRDAALAARDRDVFNRYALGKISDNTYLQYIERRIGAMEPDDPALSSWKHKLTQAAHSIAEDKLRHDVNVARTVAGQTTARKALLSFYEAYAVTLNRGSAEWRSANENIVSLKDSLSTIGRATATRKTTTAGKGAVVVAPKGTPKVILSTGSFDAALTLLTPNANSPKKDQAIAVEALRLNLNSAQDAKNDKVWLYHDPRYPGQMVTRLNPDGTVWKDANGKTMQVPGSSYRATSSDEIAGMQLATAAYSFGLAGQAAAAGDIRRYWISVRRGNDALDAARTTQAHAVQVSIKEQLTAIDKGIEAATKLNDAAAIVNLLDMKRDALRVAIADTSLDEAQRGRLEDAAAAVVDHPMYPRYEVDMAGNRVVGPDGRWNQIGGAVDLDNSPRNADGSVISAVMRPGWHFVLKTNARGEAAWRHVHEAGEGFAQGEWAENHVWVQTGVFGKVVSGYVRVKESPVSGVLVMTQDGPENIPASWPTRHISYVDGYGRTVNAYSLDGETWVQTTGGMLPGLELNGKVQWDEADDGSVTVTDGAGNVLFESGPGGAGWKAELDLAESAGALSWFGQAAAEAGGDISAGVGAEGQRFRIVTLVAGPDGLPSLNFVPREILNALAIEDQARAVARRAIAAGSKETATLAEETAAVKARGFAAPPVPWSALSPYSQTLADESAAIKARGEAETATQARRFAAGYQARVDVHRFAPQPVPGFHPGPAIKAGSSPWADAGAVTSSLADESAAIRARSIGIVSIGSAPPPPTLPPLTLTPVYVSPYVGVTLPALRPVAAPVLRAVPVTPPLAVKKGAPPSGSRIYEPEPKPAVAPVPPKPAPRPSPPPVPPALPRPGSRPRAT